MFRRPTPPSRDPAPLPYTDPEQRDRVLRCQDWPSTTMDAPGLCDVELLLNGGFAPLRGFLGAADYRRVLREERLADGALWPIPITLAVDAATAAKLAPGRMLTLRDGEGVPIAAVEVSDVHRLDVAAEAHHVYGSDDPAHPGVAALQRRPEHLVGGRVLPLQPIEATDHPRLRCTPAELRAEFARRGWQRVVTLQTSAPLHRPQAEAMLRAASDLGAGLLLHSIAGPSHPAELDLATRVRAHLAAVRHLPRDAVALAMLPLAVRPAGPRAALLQALVARNHGATHLLVEPGHADPGAATGAGFYAPSAGLESGRAHRGELQVQMVPFEPLVALTDAEVRARLRRGEALPTWFTFPEVAAILTEAYPPPARQGFTVLFTGLSGAGKSTLARALAQALRSRGGRAVTLLDGDVVRTHLSSELGFSRAHRDLNVQRIGFVASEITRHGGAAICAPIAPYDAARKVVRELVGRHGGFVLVHVATPLAVCEARDRKGLYAKARAGKLAEFTGISDPYEVPTDAEVTLDTTDLSIGTAVGEVLAWLEARGYLAAP